MRKYLKPNDRREVTVPSALVVSRIARYFRTTPNFLLGFDEAADSEDAQRAGESDVYSSLGLSQEAIEAAVTRCRKHPRTEFISGRGCLHTIFSKNI